MTYTIQYDHTYIPALNNGEECNLCGLNFAHFHRAGTLPKDFEILPEKAEDRLPEDSKTITKRTLKLITALLDCVCNQIRKDDENDDERWINYSGEKVAEIYDLIKTIDEKPNKKTDL